MWPLTWPLNPARESVVGCCGGRKGKEGAHDGCVPKLPKFPKLGPIPFPFPFPRFCEFELAARFSWLRICAS